MTPAVTRRTNAGLDWEIDLLGHLAAHGFRVPAIIPSLDGRHIDGIVVQRWLAVFKPPFVQPEPSRRWAFQPAWPARPAEGSAVSSR
jgi:hypothetical protein